MKTCTKCLESRDEHEYSKSELARKSSTCKPCIRERNKEYRVRNKERLDAKNKAYYESNRERLLIDNNARYHERKEQYKEKRNAWWEANKDRINSDRREFKSRHTRVSWVWRLKARYGITPEQFYEMLDNQDGLCKICGTDDPGYAGTKTADKVFAVDHCHTTGIVRGLLCHNCNKGLGLFADDHLRLQKAINYLQSA